MSNALRLLRDARVAEGRVHRRLPADLRPVDQDHVELTLRHHAVASQSLVVRYGGGWEWCLLALGAEAGTECWTADRLDDHERAALEARRRVLEGDG
ncbi:hypothetical protein [Microlunatus sp. GCM10028923]|uniref:hypothetical protein n=1 Tax=Microlunatus sp. GCM10028923 TaxID=3273400 RepID=UPI00361454ED